MRSYTTYLGKRLVQFVLVVFIGINLAFFVTHLTPIDPVEQSVAAATAFGAASPEAIDMVAARALRSGRLTRMNGTIGRMNGLLVDHNPPNADITMPKDPRASQMRGSQQESRNGKEFRLTGNQSTVRAGTEIQVNTERPSVSLSLSEMDEGSWVMFELPGFATAASGTKQDSMDALRKASETSYFTDTDALWVKLVAGPGVQPVLPLHMQGSITVSR